MYIRYSLTQEPIRVILNKWRKYYKKNQDNYQRLKTSMKN